MQRFVSLLEWAIALVLLGLMLVVMLGCEQDRTTVICYTADWCRQCQADKPQLQMLRDSGVKVIEIDVDRNSCSCRKVPFYVVRLRGSIRRQWRTHDINQVLKLVGKCSCVPRP